MYGRSYLCIKRDRLLRLVEITGNLRCKSVSETCCKSVVNVRYQENKLFEGYVSHLARVK